MIKSILLWLLEMTAEEVTHKTGEKASVSGIWRSEDEFVALTKTERFPPLGNGVWVLVVSV